MREQQSIRARFVSVAGPRPSRPKEAPAPLHRRLLRACLPPLLALTWFCAEGVSAAAAPGDVSTKFPVNDDNPSESLPTPEQRDRNPLEFGYLIQDLIARAENAYRAKDWAGAVKYYEALARAVPDRAITFSRLCTSYAALGKLDVASANCSAALRLPGVRVLDHFRFIQVLLQKPALSTEDVAEADASLAHLRSQLGKDAVALAPDPGSALGTLEAEAAREDARAKSLPLEVEVLACKLATHLADAQRVNACLGALQAQGASAKVRLPFEWFRALLAKDRALSGKLLADAPTLGFPAATVEAMKQEHGKVFPKESAFGGVRGLEFWPLALIAGLLLTAAAWFSKSAIARAAAARARSEELAPRAPSAPEYR